MSTKNEEDLSESQKERLIKEVVQSFRYDGRWKRIRNYGLAAMFALSFCAFLVNVTAGALKGWTGFSDYAAVVSLRGDMISGGTASADAVIPVLQKAFEDDNAKVILLEVDSGGGSPLESERIYLELERLKEKTKKPVRAVIGNLGASAAYLVAVHCDSITAGRYSLVGSIGAKSSRYDIHGLAERVGIKQSTYASGELKNMFDPFTSPDEAEKLKAQRLVDSVASTFLGEVVAKRGAKLKAGKIDTGEVWPGDESLAMGLVDDLGTVDSVAASLDLKPKRLGPVVRQSLFSGMFGAAAHAIRNEVRGEVGGAGSPVLLSY